MRSSLSVIQIRVCHPNKVTPVVPTHQHSSNPKPLPPPRLGAAPQLETLAPAILTLDTPAKLGRARQGEEEDPNQGGRPPMLSTPGCAIFCALMGYPQVSALQAWLWLVLHAALQCMLHAALQCVLHTVLELVLSSQLLMLRLVLLI